jgi:hypothetical protein
MFRSIVAVVDPAGDPSGCALEAGALAERTRARLTLFGAVPRVRTCSPVFWAVTLPPPGTPDSLQHACDCEHEALLRQAAQSVPEVVPVTMTLRRGRLHAMLLRELADADHDLVILDGARSRGLRRVALLRFARRCPAPVLIRSTEPPSRPRWGSARRWRAEPARAPQPARSAPPAPRLAPSTRAASRGR